MIAHDDHVADIVPSGELDRLRQTTEVLSDTELVHGLREGLADARAGRMYPAEQIAADLAARRAANLWRRHVRARPSFFVDRNESALLRARHYCYEQLSEHARMRSRKAYGGMPFL